MGLAERTLIISQEMIDAYRHSTGDTNDLHQRCALGFQEAFILEHAARNRAQLKDPDAVCYLMDTSFLAPVPSNSEVTHETTPTDEFARQINGQLLRNGKVAARSEFSYGTGGRLGPAPDAICKEVATIEEIAKKAHTEFDIPPTEYRLSPSDACDVGRGLGRTGFHYRELAVSRSSEPMLARGREIIYAQREGGHVPVYSKHRIIMLPESTHLGPGQGVNTYVSFTAGSQAGQYTAHVFAERTDTAPLFAATLDMVFVKEKLIQRALR